MTCSEASGFRSTGARAALSSSPVPRPLTSIVATVVQRRRLMQPPQNSLAVLLDHETTTPTVY